MENKKRKPNGPTPVVIRYEFSENETPKSYTEIVINIIKYIACQKQIPYPYDYLKLVASKKTTQAEGSSLLSSKIARLYHKASEAFEAMEKLFQHLTVELESCNSGRVEEIMVLLGSTPVSAKEIYRIQLPPLTSNEEKKCSVRNLSFRFIRHLMKSEEFHNIISKPLNPTNVYVFVKKTMGRKSDWLLPNDQYQIPVRCSQAVFSFTNSLPECESSDNKCFDIFHDGQSPSSVEDDQKPGENMGWYQSRIMFKGFKNYTEKFPVSTMNSVRGPCISKQ